MGKNMTSRTKVLGDVSNLQSAEGHKAGPKEEARAHTSKEEFNASSKPDVKPVVTFTRKAKAKKEEDKRASLSEVPGTPQHHAAQDDDASSSASPSLTDFLTPQIADTNATPRSLLSAQTPWQSVSSAQQVSREPFALAEQDPDFDAQKGGRAYPRKVAAAQKGKEGAALTTYMTQMRAYYAEVDDFELAVETPQPAPEQARRGVDTPDAQAGIAAGDESPVQDDIAAADPATEVAAERTSQWLADLPEPAEGVPSQDSDSSAQPGASALDRAVNEVQAATSADAEEGGSDAEDAHEEGPYVESIQIPMEPHAAAWGRDSRGSRSRRFSARPSLAHARKSIAGPQLLSSLLPPDRQNAGAAAGAGRRSSILEQLSSRFSLSSGLARMSLGLSDALGRLGIGGRDDAPDGPSSQPQEESSGPEARSSLLPAQGLAPKLRAFSPIAESPEAGSATPDSLPAPTPAKSAAPTPAKFGAVATAKAAKTGKHAEAEPEEETPGAEELGALLEAQLTLADEAQGAGEMSAAAAEELTPMQQLLKLCGQEGDEETLPSMEALLGRHVDLAAVTKIGEGTFGEAFRASDGVVLKIVPMEGDALVNGEPQKRAAEILAEAAVSLTLSQLHPDPGVTAQNSTAAFVRTFGVGVCRGRYAKPLVREWRAWDAKHGSENDPVAKFGADQMYVVFVVANGGADLEHFEVHGFEEARSILLQAVLALAVGEEAVEFEHRDLHWGNLLIRRVPVGQRTSARLRGVDVEASTAGVEVTLIDFTLSRLRTADGAGAFCDLAADPELFQGPRGDCQADTYRRMKKATKGEWAAFHPATNCLWVHYLADTLLQLKTFPSSPDQKKALRSFRKRALTCGSCADLLLDEFLQSHWLAGKS